MASRDKLAATGAVACAAIVLQRWCDTYDRDAAITMTGPGEVATGGASALHTGRVIEVQAGQCTVTFGPLSWWHGAAVPWLAWLASMHGAEAASDAAHALGLAATKHSPAWRNYWWAGPHSRVPGGDAGLWRRSTDGKGSVMHQVSPVHVSAYLACWQAIGRYADPEDSRLARAWEARQQRLSDMVFCDDGRDAPREE